MSVPVILGLLAFLVVAVLAVTMRGAGSAHATGAGRQSAVIVVLLVAVAGLVLYYVFGR